MRRRALLTGAAALAAFAAVTRPSRGLVALLGASGGGPRQLVADGDSITYGPGSSIGPSYAVPGVSDWPTQCLPLLHARGSTLLNIAVIGATDVHAGWDTTPPAMGSKLLVIGLGTNNFSGGQSAADFETQIRARVASRRAGGVTRIALATCATRFTPGTGPELARLAANASMSTGDLWGADIVIPWADRVDTTVDADFTDHTHPTPAGALKLAIVAAERINAIL